MRLVSVVTLVLLAGVAGCGGSSGYGTTTGPGGGGHTLSVSMSGSAFTPTPDTVTAGSTVTWTNHDAFGHTVTSVPGSADTYNASVAPSGTFSHLFATAGTYVYYCTIHGTPTGGMRGTIVVQ